MHLSRKTGHLLFAVHLSCCVHVCCVGFRGVFFIDLYARGMRALMFFVLRSHLATRWVFGKLTLTSMRFGEFASEMHVRPIAICMLQCSERLGHTTSSPIRGCVCTKLLITVANALCHATCSQVRARTFVQSDIVKTLTSRHYSQCLVQV